MKFRDKNILLVSPEAWDHIFVSKHNYAIHLGKRGNKVFFLNPPGKVEGLASTNFQGVFEVRYKGFPAGLRFYPAFLRRRITRNVYRKLQELCGTEFDIIWSFDNSVFFDFTGLPLSTLKISHIVDANQDFETKLAASTADCCLCVSEVIRTRIQSYNKRVFKVNHGFNPQSGSTVGLSGYDSGKLRAVYSGNLSIPYIDWSLLVTVIDRHPEIDFLFIGPNEGALQNRRGFEQIVERKNVLFIGRVKSYELPAYYEMADVLLVAYSEQFQEDQATNPHKVMEYLGSGKVVVASKTLEYENFYPLMVMSEKNSDWPALFARVIDNLAYYNSPELRNRRRSFALDNTYDMQINRIEEIVGN